MWSLSSLRLLFLRSGKKQWLISAKPGAFCSLEGGGARLVFELDFWFVVCCVLLMRMVKTPV